MSTINDPQLNRSIPHNTTYDLCISSTNAEMNLLQYTYIQNKI